MESWQLCHLVILIFWVPAIVSPDACWATYLMTIWSIYKPWVQHVSYPVPLSLYWAVFLGLLSSHSGCQHCYCYCRVLLLLETTAPSYPKEYNILLDIIHWDNISILYNAIFHTCSFVNETSVNFLKTDFGCLLKLPHYGSTCEGSHSIFSAIMRKIMHTPANHIFP